MFIVHSTVNDVDIIYDYVGMYKLNIYQFLNFNGGILTTLKYISADHCI